MNTELANTETSRGSTGVGSLEPLGHPFLSTDQYVTLFYVFLLRDTLFNIYYMFINIELMANSTIMKINCI